MNRRRLAFVCVVIVAVAGIGAAGYAWSARDRGCTDAVARIDDSHVDLPPFVTPGTADTQDWPPNVAARVDELLRQGASLGEPEAIVLLDPRGTHRRDAFTLMDGEVLLGHDVVLPDRASGGTPAMAMHDVPGGALRWARSWHLVSDGFGQVGDSVVLLQNGGPFTPSWVVAVDRASGDLRSCTSLVSESIERGSVVPAGRMAIATLAPGSDGTSTIHAVDAESGAVVWERELDEISGLVQSLRATDETVVFSGVDALVGPRILAARARDNDLAQREASGALAVHAVSADTGDARWSHAIEAPDGARPFVHAVVGTTDEVAVVAANRTEDFPDVDPVIHNRVIALDLATGSHVWSAELADTTWRIPDVRLFGDTILAEDVVGDELMVDLVGYAAATGEQLWRIPDHRPLDTMTVYPPAAAADASSLYLASPDGLEIVDLTTGEITVDLDGFEVHALAADGTRIGALVRVHDDLYALALYDVG